MAKKSINTIRAEKNTNIRLFEGSTKIDDKRYKRILEINNNLLVDAFIFELFLRNDNFKLIYDNCYSSTYFIKDNPALFTYQSEHYQELIKRYKKEFSSFGYNVLNVLVFISLTIAKEHSINCDSFPKDGYLKLNPLMFNFILDDNYPIHDTYYNDEENINILNFLQTYEEDCTIYTYNFNYPKHNMFKQKSINANINLYEDKKEQLKELDRLKKLIVGINHSKEITNINTIQEEIEKFVNKQKQEGILIYLYYYDCSKKGMKPTSIHELTEEYIKDLDLPSTLKAKLTSKKDNRTLTNYIKEIDTFFNKLNLI